MPLTVAVLVRNAREVAIAKKGQALVAAGELAASMGLIDSIPEQVYAEIGKQASDAFAAENVPVSVGQGVYNVQATTGYVWAKGTKTQSRLPAGQYRLLRITVLDSIGAACAEADALVGLVVAVGGQALIEQKVRETVEQKVCRKLAANGVSALLLPLNIQ